MTDAADTRSRTMRAVRSTGTGPELVVRRLVTDLGFRYRLHRADILGKPDLAFIGRRKLIFVNGCFWHGHGCQRGARMPKSNAEYWSAKIGRNVARDQHNVHELRRIGWTVMTIWECELKSSSETRRRLHDFLGATSHGD